jgi:phosphohistidine swiveling domain-containing protein
VRPAIVLPRPVEAPEWSRPTSQEGEAVVREALRLRIRWVHELTARAAWELGERLVAAGLLDDPSTVRDLTLAELEAAVHRHVAPRPAPAEPGPGRPLPTRFRLTDRGVPVAVRAGDTGGTGAGGGRGRGPVAHDPDDVPEGAVLVVGTLDPTIAPVLPRLAGLVSETGSALSHVAILAREAGIPTVVGFADARERLAEGTVVEVDGATGEVR